MQCNAMQCNAMQCNAMQCNAMQCNAMQCNAMQCNAMQWHFCNRADNRYFKKTSKELVYILNFKFVFLRGLAPG
jgi:hypothetical protein